MNELNEMDSSTLVWNEGLDMETRHTKLDAQVTILGYVIEGLEERAANTDGGKNTQMSRNFAAAYETYSKMLYSILDDLQEFVKEFRGGVDDIFSIARHMKNEAPCTTADQSTVQEAR